MPVQPQAEDFRARMLAELRGEVVSPEESAAFAEAARREGVAGLLRGDDEALSAAKRYLRFCAISAGATSRQAVDALNAEGIPCVVLKGTPVASLAWSQPSARPQVDVDLLVARRQLDAAQRCLDAAGLLGARVGPDTGRHNRSFSAAPGQKMPLEIHHSLSSDIPLRVSDEDLLARRADVETPEGPLPALSPAHTLAHVSLHAATSAFTQLSWVVDVAGLLTRHPGIARNAAQSARRWGAAAAVALAWRHAQRLLNAPVEDSAFAALGISELRLRGLQTLMDQALAREGVARRRGLIAFRLALQPDSRRLATVLGARVWRRVTGDDWGKR